MARKQLMELMRKSPKQERAQETIRTIFETTAQILQDEGEGALTTNRVAKRSGFSVGTIYQYFSNKNALLVAMAEHEKKRVIEQIREALSDCADLPLETAIRRAVVISLQIFKGRIRARRAMMRTMITGNASMEAFTAHTNDVATFMATSLIALNHPKLRELTDTSIFVMSRSMLGAIRLAVLEDSSLLGQQVFEDELVILVCRYLTLA